MNRRRFLRSGLIAAAGVQFTGLLTSCGTDTGADRTATPTTSAAPPSTASPPRTSDPAAPSSTSSSTSTTTTTTMVATAAIAAWCREAWGAAEVGTGLEPHTIERMTVHHTAALLSDNRRAPGRLRSHQAYHQSLGWPDLAYHFAVDAEGNVYEGRTPSARGDTATEYDPTGHFLVVAEGNFDAQEIPAAQLASVADVLAWAAVEFGVGPDTIAGHRDYAATTCPGAAFYPIISSGELEAMVRRRVGAVTVAVTCGPDAEAAIKAIEAGEAPPAAEARFYLKHDNGPGPADETFVFGAPGWIPVSGNVG